MRTLGSRWALRAREVFRDLAVFEHFEGLGSRASERRALASVPTSKTASASLARSFSWLRVSPADRYPSLQRLFKARPGLVALGTSMAMLGCGNSTGHGEPAIGAGPGAGGALVGAGVPNTTTGAGGASAIVGGAGAPTGNGGTFPTGAAGAITGQAGVSVGGAPSGGAPTTGTSSGGAPTTGASSGGAPSGGATDASSGGGLAGGAAGASPNGGAAGAMAAADPPGTVTLTTDTFQLLPGQEVYKCQNFDNPFQGQDTPVFKISTDMSKGSHHLFVFNLVEGTGRTLEDCSISDFHPIVHTAGSPHAETTYPDGMATKIYGSTGLRIQLHYVNTTSDVLPVGATAKLSPSPDPQNVTKWVAQLYMNREILTVPPGMGQTVTTTCSIPATYGAIGLVLGMTHMHMRGVREVATTNTGLMLADVNTWNEPPPIPYSPPIMMNPGDFITWTCTYNNSTSQTFTFGQSATDNEMCIYEARYFSSNANDTQIACQALSEQGGTAEPQLL